MVRKVRWPYDDLTQLKAVALVLSAKMHDIPRKVAALYPKRGRDAIIIMRPDNAITFVSMLSRCRSVLGQICVGHNA